MAISIRLRPDELDELREHAVIPELTKLEQLAVEEQSAGFRYTLRIPTDDAESWEDRLRDLVLDEHDGKRMTVLGEVYETVADRISDQLEAIYRSEVRDQIKAKLKKYPDIKYEENLDSIRVLPMEEDGFEVSFTEGGNGYIVAFEGWHEEFENAEEALECFAFGLSDSCQLKITMRGDFPHRWTVESREGDTWVEDSTTGLLLFPFWRRAKITYKQNSLAQSAKVIS